MIIKEMFKCSLLDTKVVTNGKSAEIQKVFFALGFKWSSGDTEIMYEGAKYLFVSDYGRITWCDRDLSFTGDKRREITADYILNTEWGDFDFKPYDKVLVRPNRGVWIPAFFSRIVNGEIRVLGDIHKYSECIPWEGNEELVFTSKNVWEEKK